MQIFNLFFKIFKSKIAMASVYVVVFMVLVLALTNTGGQETSFVQTSVDFTVIDRDNSNSSRALVEYLCENNNFVEIKDEKEEILDALFNYRINYALVIKEGYEEKLSKGEISNVFENYKSPNMSSGLIIESQVDGFAKTACAFVLAGNSLTDANLKTKEAMSDSVEVEIMQEKTAENEDFSQSAMYYYQYLSYILISVIMTVICPVLLAMNKKDIKDRTNCSCVKFSSQTVQITIASVLGCVLLWVIFNIFGVIFTSPAIGEKLFLAMLNSFVMTLITLGICLVAVSFLKTENSIGMISNIIGLGMSFLCGVFVPQSLLGEGVLSVSRFLPAYWYVKVTDMLGGVSDVKFETSVALRYIFIEFVFAVIIFICGVIISRFKKVKN